MAHVTCVSCGTTIAPGELKDVRADLTNFVATASPIQLQQFALRLGLPDEMSSDDLVEVPLCRSCVDAGLMWTNVD